MVPKNLDSEINQEALRLGVFGTATKTTNTAWACCPFAFCAGEMPLLLDAVCSIHWGCTTAFCALWWLDMKVPSDSGQAPFASSPDASCQPSVQPPTHPWHSALQLHSQKSSARGAPGWVQGWDIHPAVKPYKKDLCLGLYLWNKEHCLLASSCMPGTQAGTGTCDLEQNLCSTESKGQRLVTRWKSSEATSTLPKELPMAHLCSSPVWQHLSASSGCENNCDSRWYLLPCESHSVCLHTCFDLFCLDLQYHSCLDKCKVTYRQRGFF